LLVWSLHPYPACAEQQKPSVKQMLEGPDSISPRRRRNMLAAAGGRSRPSVLEGMVISPTLPSEKACPVSDPLPLIHEGTAIRESEARRTGSDGSSIPSKGLAPLGSGLLLPSLGGRVSGRGLPAPDEFNFGTTWRPNQPAAQPPPVRAGRFSPRTSRTPTPLPPATSAVGQPSPRSNHPTRSRNAAPAPPTAPPARAAADSLADERKRATDLWWVQLVQSDAGQTELGAPVRVGAARTILIPDRLRKSSIVEGGLRFLRDEAIVAAQAREVRRRELGPRQMGGRALILRNMPGPVGEEEWGEFAILAFKAEDEASGVLNVRRPSIYRYSHVAI